MLPLFPQFKKVSNMFQVGKYNLEMTQKIEENEKQLSSDTWNRQSPYPKAPHREKAAVKGGVLYQKQLHTEGPQPHHGPHAHSPHLGRMLVSRNNYKASLSRTGEMARSFSNPLVASSYCL